MPVDPQVQGVLDAMVAAGITELSALPVDVVRAATLEMSRQRGTGEDVAEVRDLAIPGPAGTIPARLYRPLGSAAGDVLGVLVWYHGGGWTIGSVEGSDRTTRALANRSGCAVVSIDYRMGPEDPFPAAVDDCWAATQWVAAHAGELGVDAGRLAVGGDSAGGNLAAVVALLARDAGGPAIGFQLLVYPAVDAAMPYASIEENATGKLLTRNDIDWFYGHYGRRTTVDAADWRLSPIKAASHAGLPAAHVITAQYDPLRDEGEHYAQVLRAAGVPVTCTRYDGMVHGFFGMPEQVDVAAQAQAESGAIVRAALA